MDHHLIKIVKNINNQLLLSLTFYKKICHIESVKTDALYPFLCDKKIKNNWLKYDYSIHLKILPLTYTGDINCNF